MGSLPIIFRLHGIFIGLKPFAGIVLLLVVIFPFLGTLIWMEGRLASIQHTVSLKMKKATSVEDQLPWTFSIQDAATKLHWEHSREFEYKGEMYDVIRTTYAGDSVTYWCYWDRKETKLRKQRNVIVFNLLGPPPQERNHQSQITDFFRGLFYHAQDPQHADRQMPSVRHCIIPYFPLRSDYLPDPQAPPPKWLEANIS